MCWCTRYKNGVLEQRPSGLHNAQHLSIVRSSKMELENSSIHDFGRLELTEGLFGF